jgi:dTDP-4-amino-4,6-dideoxygalactose transaminase
LDEIKNICEDENLIFIEDAAQAFGSKFKDKYAGTYGNYGCFSFHETKNIHCGMGGAFVTDNEQMYEKAMIIWERGTDRQKKLRGLVDKYTWREIGGSYYPSEFQAAFLLAQLEQYEKNFLKRKMLYEMYEERIDPISKKFNFFYRKISKETSSNYHSFYIILKSEKDCKGLISYLEKSNIYAFIGYTPLHTSPVGKKAFPSNLPVTDDISNRVLRLPFHNYLTKKDILLVVNKIKDYFEGI